MSGKQDVYQQLMQDGHSAAWDGNWKQAAGYYRQALEELPSEHRALTSLGLALFELDEFDEALVCYSKAAVVSPGDPLSFEKIAQISEILGKTDYVTKAGLQAEVLYAKRGEIDKAVENLTRVTRVDAENLPAHARLAILYERQGYQPQAVQECIAIASLLQQRGEVEKAIQAVSHALEILPESGEAQRALTSLQEAQPLPKPVRSSGGPFQVRVPVSDAKVEDPGDGSTGEDPISDARRRALSSLAGLVFDQPANLPGTKRDIQSIMTGIPGTSKGNSMDSGVVWQHLNLAVACLSQGQETEAADELEAAIEAGIEHAAAFFNLGMIRIQQGRQESGLRYLQHAVKHIDFALGARLLIASTARKINRIDQAAMEYLEALKIADSQIIQPELSDELAQLYEPVIEAESKRTGQAHKEEICDAVADLLMKSDWRERTRQARAALPSAGDSPPIPLGEVISDSRASQVVEAINAINRLARSGLSRSAMEEAYFALQTSPTYLPLHVQMGELLIQQNRLREATDKFSVVAQTYNSRGDLKRAIQTLRKVIRAAPMDLVARNQLIQLLLERGQVEDAIQGYLDMAEVYFNLADLARARQTYLQALGLAQRFHCDESLLVHILYQVADIDLQSLDWRGAVQHFDQIRQLRPGDLQARAALVELNIRLGRRVESEQEVAEYIRAIEASDGNEKVVDALEALTIEYPEHYFLQERLAEAYQKIGRRARAVETYVSLLETYQNSGKDMEARSVQEKLSLISPKK